MFFTFIFARVTKCDAELCLLLHKSEILISAARMQDKGSLNMSRHNRWKLYAAEKEIESFIREEGEFRDRNWSV